MNSTTLKSQLRVANVGANKTTVKIFVNNVLKTSIVDLAAGSSKVVTVSGTGLMKVVSTNSAVNIITSMRQIYYQNNVPVSYSELMGYPISKLTIEYAFPWYTTNANMTTKLYIVNMGTADTTVEVYIKGNLKGSYPLAKGASKAVSYSGIDNGPVRLNSTNSGVKILTSMQITYKQNGLPVSYAELTGYPYLVSQPTTSYLFPWYTNNTAFQSQLIFGYP
jgi:hypothetical protein